MGTGQVQGLPDIGFIATVFIYHYQELILKKSLGDSSLPTSNAPTGYSATK